MAERRALLLRLKGLGPAFAATLVNEVFYKDFRNRREVAGYCGLAPSPWCSGGMDREQGISKAGNPRARLKAVELAWLWRRHQPALVRRPHRQCQQTDQAHRHHRPGAQADRGDVALSHHRSGSRPGRAEGITM
jgi:transposase